MISDSFWHPKSIENCGEDILRTETIQMVILFLTERGLHNEEIELLGPKNYSRIAELRVCHFWDCMDILVHIADFVLSD